MDYEKKYKEALEKLRDFYRDYDTVSCLIDVKEELANLFPELKESEDERIRKWLIEMVGELRKANPTNADHNGDCSYAIAWLEKQKEPELSNDLGEYIVELSKQFPEVSFAKLSRVAVRVAKWQKEQDQSTIELAEDHAYFAGRTKTIDEINEALLSEVLPCFMHGGEADEVVAKLDEVLNQKK